MDGNRNLHSLESGQSTIEFLASFVFVFSFMVMIIRFAINATNGYLVHYATFMASRAYLVYDNNTNTPEGADAAAFAQAKKVFNSYSLSSFLGTDPELKVNPPEYGGISAYVGIYSKFEQPFSIPNFFGGSTPLDMVSESFLGREPTRATCAERVCAGMSESGGTCEKNSTFFDNGC